MQLELGLSFAFAFLAATSTQISPKDAEITVSKAVAYFEKQNTHRFPSGEYYEVLATIQETEKSDEKITQLAFIDPDGGLFASQRSRQASTTTYVYLANPKYGAMITRGRMGTTESKVALESLGTGFSLTNVWHADSNSFNNMVSTELFARYLNFGNVPFAEAVSQWRRKSGGLEACIPDPKKNLIELSFSNFPIGDDGKMVYRVDAGDYTIKEMEGTFQGTKATLVVDRFFEIHGIKLPQKTSLSTKNVEFGHEVRKVVEWKIADPALAGFKKEQLYLPHYGLPDPDLNNIPTKPRTYIPYLLAMVVLLVGIGIVAVKYKRSN